MDEGDSELVFFVQDILDVDDPNSDPNQLDDGKKRRKNILSTILRYFG